MLSFMLINTKGTWEERDMTDLSKVRITDMCKEIQAVVESGEHYSEVCATVTGKSREPIIALLTPRTL